MGNTLQVEKNVHKTVMQVAEDWKKNILSAENCINRHFDGRDMSDNAFSAMVSAAFNLGCYRLRTYFDAQKGRRTETTIHRMALAHLWHEMCLQLPSFDSGGRYPGLTVRRKKEMELCLRDTVKG
ncbi:MAG: glycoside hydrolase family protein [Pantoea sp.]